MGNRQPDTFQLIIRPFPSHEHRYRVYVQVVDRNDNMVLFRITGGKKFMTMQKTLKKRAGDWQILDRNFEFGATEAFSSFFILELRKQLDEYILSGKTESL